MRFTHEGGDYKISFRYHRLIEKSQVVIVAQILQFKTPRTPGIAPVKSEIRQVTSEIHTVNINRFNRSRDRWVALAKATKCFTKDFRRAVTDAFLSRREIRKANSVTA